MQHSKRPTDVVTIVINGQSQQIASAMSVDQLLRDHPLPGAYLAVEVNGQVVPREQLANTPLGEGDVIEVVTLVGGG
jgi:thiamine biosynthesis protein ThiS